jgi:hypothetical protein
MTVSGSNDFSQTTYTIIQDALILCNGLEDDEPVPPEQLTHSMRALNRMVKAWSVRGLKAWCYREEVLPMVTGQNSYTIGPTGDLVTERPISVTNVRKVTDGDETPVRMFARQEYMDQPSKTTLGEPVAVYYDPQLDNGVLYVWQSPETGQTLNFTSRQYIEDFDTQLDTAYFPVEWLDTLVYNLADRLGPKYSLSGEDAVNIERKALKFLRDSEGSDQEQASIFLGLEYHP